MMILLDFTIRKEYYRIKALEGDLSKIIFISNWDQFRILELLIYKVKRRRPAPKQASWYSNK